MRIDSNQGGQTVSEDNRTGASSHAANSASSPANSGLSEDQAQLSGAHALVQALAAEASRSPGMHEEARQEKVSALRQAVQNGAYHPSPEKVAEALFSHLLAARAA